MNMYEIQPGSAQAAHGYAPDEMSTGERTGAAKLKWVVIVDQSLSPGQVVIPGLSKLSIAARTRGGVNTVSISREESSSA